jgi:hypothetical protein
MRSSLFFSLTVARAAVMLVAQASLVVAFAQTAGTSEPPIDPQIQARLDRAVQHYQAVNIEAAVPVLQDLLWPPSRRLTKAQEIKVQQYLGAAFAVAGKRDSALAHFRFALFLSPTLELDRSGFGATEIALFAEAKGSSGRMTLMIGTRTPGATLFIDGESRGELSVAPRSIALPANSPIRLSVKADKCIAWDSTITARPDSTIVLGRKNLSCL